MNSRASETNTLAKKNDHRRSISGKTSLLEFNIAVDRWHCWPIPERRLQLLSSVSFWRMSVIGLCLRRLYFVLFPCPVASVSWFNHSIVHAFDHVAQGYCLI